MGDPGDPCEYLEWDSEFFGFRVARVTTTRLTRERLAAVLAWCYAKRIVCLYFLADAGDRDTAWVAHDVGFRPVDLRITLETDLEGDAAERGAGQAVAMRPSTRADVPDLRAIARQSHRASRFYHDPNFPRAMCDALYETWIERSCQGYADMVLVAERDGRVTGYVSCHLTGDRVGKIGLLGVAPDAQGKGTGRLLAEEARRWFAGQGMRRAVVVTQGRNAQAQRLYQRCGFVTRSVDEWYHRWFDQRAPGVGP